jgi:hypothetical protein
MYTIRGRKQRENHENERDDRLLTSGRSKTWSQPFHFTALAFSRQQSTWTHSRHSRNTRSSTALSRNIRVGVSRWDWSWAGLGLRKRRLNWAWAGLGLRKRSFLLKSNRSGGCPMLAFTTWLKPRCGTTLLWNDTSVERHFCGTTLLWNDTTLLWNDTTLLWNGMVWYGMFIFHI